MTAEAAPLSSVRPPGELWFPFAVLVLLGLVTTVTAVGYLAVVTTGLLGGEGGTQWVSVPFGLGLLALGVGALSGAEALWRRRGRARAVALVVLPLLAAVVAVDRLVVSDGSGLPVEPVAAALLLLVAVAWAVFLLPSVRTYYRAHRGAQPGGASAHPSLHT